MGPRDLARFAAHAYDRGVRLSLHTSRRAAEETLRLIGFDERPGQPAEPRPDPRDGEQARRSLRQRGEELLRRSADVNFDEDAHPAYIRILDDLSPDEARILRLLYEGGAQPSVDVRSGLLPIQSTSELVASGLNMIGSEAGARHVDDVPAYLNNLNRLGLIWFSRETVPEQRAYQVLEAQPEVANAMEGARHTRTIRRSILLTPFGRDFCELCLVDSAGETREPDAGEDGNRES
jgi:abortive infection alpha-like protein